jgi:hypothetical protein
LAGDEGTALALRCTERRVRTAEDRRLGVRGSSGVRGGCDDACSLVNQRYAHRIVRTHRWVRASGEETQRRRDAGGAEKSCAGACSRRLSLRDLCVSAPQRFPPAQPFPMGANKLDSPREKLF